MRSSKDALLHDIRNALSIAQSNVEGMIDGILPMTPERLEGVRDALVSARALLEDWQKL